MPNAQETTTMALGGVLETKICGTLADWGYESADVSKVSKIVARNLLSTEWTAQHGTALDADDLLGLVPSLVRTMMKQDGKSRPYVHVNSNEPVLLIDNLGGLSAADLNSVTGMVMNLLHNAWNIWPVRIYAGSFTESEQDLGLSIALLNVSNTDIGGPSMIQLLDGRHAPGGWNNFVVKETWNGRNMLTRVERPIVTKQQVDMAFVGEKEPILAVEEIVPEAAEIDDTPPAAPKKHEEAGKHVQELSSPTEAVGGQPLSASRSHESSESVPVAEPRLGFMASLGAALGLSSKTTSPKSTPVEEAQEPVLSALENTSPVQDEENAPKAVVVGPETEQMEDTADRPDVQHPTWEREDEDESLLDMVRKQAQKLGVSSEDGDSGAGNEYATAAPRSTEHAGLVGEEDYEVV